jgi:hypothetical protein
MKSILKVILVGMLVTAVLKCGAVVVALAIVVLCPYVAASWFSEL